MWTRPSLPEASNPAVPDKSGGLNGSVQHWLEVYSQEFQNPRSLAGVDSGAGLFCPGPIG